MDTPSNYIFSSCVQTHNLCFTFAIVTIFAHFQSIQAGSFYQTGFPTSFQDYSGNQQGFDFSPIEPLPVREILSDHGLVSPGNSKNKFSPRSKVEVLFVDLNDIEKKPYSSSVGRKNSNSIQSRPFVNSINQPYNSRSSNYYQEPSQSRNSFENRQKKIKIERIEEIHERSLPAEMTLAEILKIIPQVEAQFAKKDRQSRQKLSEPFNDESSQSYSENTSYTRENKNKSSRLNNRDSKTYNRSYREITYYH